MLIDAWVEETLTSTFWGQIGSVKRLENHALIKQENHRCDNSYYQSLTMVIS